MGKASCVQLGSSKSPAINRGPGGHDGESECHTCCDKGPNFDHCGCNLTLAEAFRNVEPKQEVIVDPKDMTSYLRSGRDTSNNLTMATL